MLLCFSLDFVTYVSYMYFAWEYGGYNSEKQFDDLLEMIYMWIYILDFFIRIFYFHWNVDLTLLTFSFLNHWWMLVLDYDNKYCIFSFVFAVSVR